MMDEIKISKVKFLRSISRVVRLVIYVLILSIIFFIYMTPEINNTPLRVFYGFPVLFAILTLGPAIIIYINYLRINRNTIVSVDFSNLTYKIESDSLNITFSDEDIISSTLVFGSRFYFGVGYLKLEISGQKDYVYLTSLLFDLVNIPFRVDDKYDVVLPLIAKEQSLKHDNQIKNKTNRFTIDTFKKQYANKSSKDLILILNEPDKYQKEAVIAAQELLNDINTTHNKKYT